MLCKKCIESIVDYIMSNDIDKIRECEIYNRWVRTTNTILKDPQDVQYAIELIKDFKTIKDTRLSKLL